MANINYTTRTDGQTKVHSLIWTIPNYLYIFEKKTIREIRSKPEIMADPRFQVKMQFLGQNYDLIEVFYQYPAAIFLKAIVIVCLRGFEERSIVIQDYRTIQAKKWQYIATLFRRDIGEHNGAFILADGSLRLKLQFYVTNDVKVEDDSNVPAPQLANDLESLLSQGLFSDVTIKSFDGSAFNVHKAILASRSAVMKAHFEHNTKECHTNIIESALEPGVLREVLNFIYSDKANKLDEIPDKLLAAADYYQLTRLKSLCEEALHKNVTIENAIDTLHLANLHSASNLKRLTLEFIKDGQAKLITKTLGWTSLQSIELIKTIYEYIVEDDLNVDIK